MASIIAMACATIVYPSMTLAERVVTRLEHQFPRVDVGDGRDFVGVIALGGSPHRLREAGRLAEVFPHLVVVVSGAGARNKVLSMLGAQIEPHRVLVEEDARTTHENALFSARITHHYGGRWLLVTSASHMPRAIGAFRNQATTVHPWPVFDRPVRSSSIVRREVLGLVAYWLLRRSTGLFPAPL